MAELLQPNILCGKQGINAMNSSYCPLPGVAKLLQNHVLPICLDESGANDLHILGRLGYRKQLLALRVRKSQWHQLPVELVKIRTFQWGKSWFRGWNGWPYFQSNSFVNEWTWELASTSYLGNMFSLQVVNRRWGSLLPCGFNMFHGALVYRVATLHVSSHKTRHVPQVDMIFPHPEYVLHIKFRGCLGARNARIYWIVNIYNI